MHGNYVQNIQSIRVPYSRKFSPILPPALVGESFIHKFLSCINDYVEDMVQTFTALAKIYSTKYFCNTKVAGLGEIFGYVVLCDQNITFNDVMCIPSGSW